MANEEDEESADESSGKEVEEVGNKLPSSESPLHRQHWRKWEPYKHPPKYYSRKVDRYNRLLNQYKAEILCDDAPDTLSIPNKRPLNFHDSFVVHTPWTAEEKAKFFTALARCGKGNLSEVAKRIGTKGLVEVTAYVGLLDEAVETRREKFTGYNLRKVPAAAEVDEDWLKFEDKMVKRLAKREVVSPIQTDLEDIPEEEDQLFNSQAAGELLEM